MIPLASFGLCHSTLPVVTSNAYRRPSSEPLNARPLAVVATPPFHGSLLQWLQSFLPVFTSMACNSPYPLLPGSGLISKLSPRYGKPSMYVTDLPDSDMHACSVGMTAMCLSAS